MRLPLRTLTPSARPKESRPEDPQARTPARLQARCEGGAQARETAARIREDSGAPPQLQRSQAPQELNSAASIRTRAVPPRARLRLPETQMLRTFLPLHRLPAAFCVRRSSGERVAR